MKRSKRFFSERKKSKTKLRKHYLGIGNRRKMNGFISYFPCNRRRRVHAIFFVSSSPALSGSKRCTVSTETLFRIKWRCFPQFDSLSISSSGMCVENMGDRTRGKKKVRNSKLACFCIHCVLVYVHNSISLLFHLIWHILPCSNNNLVKVNKKKKTKKTMRERIIYAFIHTKSFISTIEFCLRFLFPLKSRPNAHI